MVFWFLIRKRVWIIKENNKTRADARDALQMIAFIGSAFTLGFSQSFVLHSFSSKSNIDNVSQILGNDTDRYFEVSEYEVIKDQMSYSVENRVISGRHSIKISIDVYTVFPFKESPNVWYGVNFSKTIPYGSDEENESKLQSFLKECDHKIRVYDFYSGYNFERIAHSDRRDGYINAINNGLGANASTDEAIILIPSDKAYRNLGDEKAKWVFIILAIWLGATLLLLLFAPVNDKLLTEELTLRKGVAEKIRKHQDS